SGATVKVPGCAEGSVARADFSASAIGDFLASIGIAGAAGFVDSASPGCSTRGSLAAVLVSGTSVTPAVATATGALGPRAMDSRLVAVGSAALASSALPLEFAGDVPSPLVATAPVVTVPVVTAFVGQIFEPGSTGMAPTAMS